MRILCVSQGFPPASFGIAVFTHKLCSELSRIGNQVDVLTPLLEGCEKFDAMQTYRVYRYLSPRRVSSIVPIQRTMVLHNKYRYDVIFIGHFTTTHNLGALLLRKFKGVPYVILSHGNDLSYRRYTKLDKIAAKWLAINAAMMLGNSGYTKELLRKTRYHGPIEVLNPGVDIKVFHPGVDSSKVRLKLGLDCRRVLLTTANLVTKKNVDGVLRSLPKVIEQIPEVLYLVAGDGVERGRLEALCDELDLRHYVRFLGYIENSDLPGLYCASDLFVMPSYEADCGGGIETFGIVFVEANACGLPVIGGKSGGIADAVVHGETGLLVDPHDVDAIADAIILLLTDRELSRRLGEDGRRRVEKELNWKKVGERLESYLKQVVGGE